MEKITITIPTGLSHKEEVFAIAKGLDKSLLPQGQKSIGDGYTVQHLETQVIVIRKPVEKITITQECNCCGTIFKSLLGKNIFVNYGGKIKKRLFCSIECGDKVIELCGSGRAARSRRNLT